MQKISTYKKVNMTKHCAKKKSIYPMNPWIFIEHLVLRIKDAYDEVENKDDKSHTIEVARQNTNLILSVNA